MYKKDPQTHGWNTKNWMMMGALLVLGACSREEGSVTSLRSSVAGDSNAEGATYAEVGVALTSEAPGMGLTGLSLTSSKIVRYSAKVEGGVKCFGDLYQNGTQDGVEIDVAAGQKLKIRKGGTDCNVIFTKLQMEGGVVATKMTEGLSYRLGSTATLEQNKDSLFYVSVAKGPKATDKTVTDDIVVELVGRNVQRSEAVVASAEKFVAVAGEAYSAPHVGMNATTFNGKYYFALTCIGAQTADGCQDARNQKQELKDMSVWLTNDGLMDLKAEERHSEISKRFKANATIDGNYATPGFPGYRLSVGGSPILSMAYKFAVIKLTEKANDSFKVLEIKAAP